MDGERTSKGDDVREEARFLRMRVDRLRAEVATLRRGDLRPKLNRRLRWEISVWRAVLALLWAAGVLGALVSIAVTAAFCG